MKPIVDEQKINNLLARGVDEVITKEELKKKLCSGEQLRIKFGIDPTSPDIHIGRATHLLKLRDFQELGHKIVFILGDFTGTIGDTSDKDSERPMLSREVVDANMETYVEQAAKIVDMSECEIRHNSEWLGKLSYDDICKQADAFSVADFIARDNIKNRLDAGKRVSLREVLYPLMQGYDSVAVQADVEIGGKDQRFNLLAGRTLQNFYNQTPQNIVMGPLLEGTDGRKMSSSWGNTIKLTMAPDDMYGKVMAVHDSLIIKYFTLATRVSLETVAQYETAIATGDNPKDYKMKLAKTLVAMYHGEEAANRAEEAFTSTFAKGGIPENITAVQVETGKLLADALQENSLVKSKSDFRRLVDEGAIENMISSEKITDPLYKITEEIVVRIGKNRFLKISI